eukprot:TRINITY_DN1223_c0_g2_i1.p2 TRINITY_DN1223_c0_g2~~TRINITY_DN1223_c0_g2_i1.p2  ORF type:complete len:140 (-),score=36.78 TRINITY_DN1223_c0_g2_i1:140-559(-)
MWKKIELLLCVILLVAGTYASDSKMKASNDIATSEMADEALEVSESVAEEDEAPLALSALRSLIRGDRQMTKPARTSSTTQTKATTLSKTPTPTKSTTVKVTGNDKVVRDSMSYACVAQCGTTSQSVIHVANDPTFLKS